MAKMPLSKVRVTDNASGEVVEYQATSWPKKTTVGNSFFGTLNYKGLAKIQAKWPSITDEKAYLNLITQLVNAQLQASGLPLMTSDDIGDRGGSWNSPEARAKFSVEVNGEQFEPPLSAKAIAAATPKIETEPIAIEEVQDLEIEEAPEPIVEEVVVEKAVADTTDKDAKNLATLIEALSSGADKAMLRESLTKVAGAEKTAELFAKAEAQLEPNPFA